MQLNFSVETLHSFLFQSLATAWHFLLLGPPQWVCFSFSKILSFCTIFAHSLSNTHFFNRQSHLFFLFNLNTLAHSDLLYICPCLSHLLSHTIHSNFVSPSYSISLHTLSLSLSISLFLSLPLSLTLSNAVLYLSYSTSISLTRPLSLLLYLNL